MEKIVPIVCASEVHMVEESVVDGIKALCQMGYGTRRIARELGLARNTVKRYLGGAEAGVQKRTAARRLSSTERAAVEELFRTTAAGNAVVVHELLEEAAAGVSLRTVQRAVAPLRAEARRAAVVTPRFETAPGHQVQIDFGERFVLIGGAAVRVYFFVATLSYSRRIYVRAGLSQRQDEWKLGLEGALQHFGGRPEVVVVDNARALVLSHAGGEVAVHPSFHAYCTDRGLAVYACRPYRARTKGKVESGVKYVKRNAIAGRAFDDLVALQRHLDSWMDKADRRLHGTTQRAPRELFDEAEAKALRPLHAPTLDVAVQRLKRKVANDCYVDVDTIRYSVPHRFARQVVEVRQTADEIIVWHDGDEIARHRKGRRPAERVTDPAHFKGLLFPVREPVAPRDEGRLTAYGASLPPYSASLATYAAIVGGAP